MLIGRIVRTELQGSKLDAAGDLDAVRGVGGYPNRSSGGYNPNALGRLHRDDARGRVDQLTDAMMVRADETTGFPVRGNTRNKRVRCEVEQRRRSMDVLAVCRHMLSIYMEIAAPVDAKVPGSGWIDEEIRSRFDKQLRNNEVAPWLK